MADDGRLSIGVTHADGRVTRWGPDELEGRDIPNDLTFSTSIPGGFQDMTCSLLRRIDQDYPDQNLFDTVTVHGPGNEIVWQGRMQQFPRSHGASQTITPGAVGWSAHLQDFAGFTEIYVDRDTGRWSDPTLARRMAGLVIGFPIAAGPTNTQGTVELRLDRIANTATKRDTVEAWYLTHGLPVGRVVANVNMRDQSNAQLLSTWDVRGFLTDDSIATTTNVSADLCTGAAPTATLDLSASGVTKFGAILRMYYDGTSTGDGPWQTYWTNVAVYGIHGLTLRTIPGEPAGVFASDVIANAVARAAPMLSTVGVDPTTFAIPHLAYHDPTTAEFVISDANKYHLYDWGVYGDREFFYRQPNPDRLCWEARLGDGATMEADGLTGEQVTNGVIVSYTDVDGNQKTVGPPGAYFDSTSTALADTSAGNPLNTHGLTKWDTLALSFPTTLTAAIQIGRVYFAERSLATRRGSLTLTGAVQHPTLGKVPVSRVKAGDWVRVADLNGENADVQRKIISTSYSHQSRSITLSLDNTVAKLDAILARVGVQTGIMTGGGF